VRGLCRVAANALRLGIAISDAFASPICRGSVTGEEGSGTDSGTVPDTVPERVPGAVPDTPARAGRFGPAGRRRAGWRICRGGVPRAVTGREGRRPAGATGGVTKW